MAATNNFEGFSDGVGDSYPHAFVITKHDVDELPNVTRAIYIGGTGHMKVLTVSGETVLFSALPVGTILRIRAKQVFSTDTTATLMVGMY